MSEFNMYIPVRDETSFMIKYYQYLFNKYWGNHVNVYFLGYKKPDIKFDKNIHFVSLAEKRDPSPNAWSNNLIDYFKSIDDKYFYFSLEDLLIIRPVDQKLLEACRSMMDNSVGRIDLWNSVQFGNGRRGHVSYYKTHMGVKFLIENQNPPQSVYRVSCSNSIWNKNWFLKTLERDFSTLDWETKANDGRNNNDGFNVLSTIDRWTPTVVHSLGKRWGGRINVQGMLKEDIDYLLEISSEDERKEFIDVTNIVPWSTVINLEGYQPNEGDISNI
jgi:hypothetical protein